MIKRSNHHILKRLGGLLLAVLQLVFLSAAALAQPQEGWQSMEERIRQAVMDHLTEVGEFPQELLQDVETDAVWDEQEQRYTVTASIDKDAYYAAKPNPDQLSSFDLGVGGFVEGNLLCFRIWLDQAGAYLDYYNASAPENRAELTLEEGQAIAEKALEERLGVEKAELDGLALRSTYAEGYEYELEEGRFRAVCTYMWNEPDGEGRYFVDVDAKTGRMVHAFDWRESAAMKEKEGAWIDEIRKLMADAGVNDTLTNQRDVFFWSWTIEEKAAWSQAARPIVQQYLSEHPEFSQYLEDILANRYEQRDWPLLITVTQYLYGVPDSAAIAQERAFDIAREAALERGAKRESVDESKGHTFYYDVTDPDRPVWKVLVSTMFPDGDTTHPHDPTAPWGYFAVIDAHTGELLTVTVRTVNTDMRELV